MAPEDYYDEHVVSPLWARLRASPILIDRNLRRELFHRLGTEDARQLSGQTCEVDIQFSREEYAPGLRLKETVHTRAAALERPQYYYNWGDEVAYQRWGFSSGEHGYDGPHCHKGGTVTGFSDIPISDPDSRDNLVEELFSWMERNGVTL